MICALILEGQSGMICTAVPSYMLGSRRELRDGDVVPGQLELVEMKVETGTAESCQPKGCMPGA